MLAASFSSFINCCWWVPSWPLKDNLLMFRGNLVNKRWKVKGEVNKHTDFINSASETGDKERCSAFNLSMLLSSTDTTPCARDCRGLSANHAQLPHGHAKARSLPTPPPQPAPRSSSGCNKAQYCSSQLFFSTLRSLAALPWANNLLLLGTRIFVAGSIFQRFAFLAKLWGWILSCTLNLLGTASGDRQLM